jgi:hypothetical protein
MDMSKTSITKLIFLILFALVAWPVSATSQVTPAGPDVFPATHFALMPPLREMKRPAPAVGAPTIIQHPPHELKGSVSQTDPVLQTKPGGALSVATGLTFYGIDDTTQAAQTGVLYAPPDTNGAVGATQYVQWVNYAYEVFDKSTGSPLSGAIPGNNLWWALEQKNPPDACYNHNSGDQIVQYDKLANRWVMMQPIFSKPYGICIAVSVSSDAQDAFYTYEFLSPPLPNYFPDYPKLGVWSDGYYLSYDQYTGLGAGGKFKGAYVCAFNRDAMLNGRNDKTMLVCFSVPGNYQSLLPADLDGLTPPPAKSPEIFMSLGANALNFWRFHVDFSNPSGSTFTPGTPLSIPAPNFAGACGGGAGNGNGSSGGNCIPQLGTSQPLEALGDRLMYRLAYRNFTDPKITAHEALVANHSVTAGSGVGVRWYELRTSPTAGVYPTMASTAPQIYQSGTFFGDGKFRWMGSIAMDHIADIALGYSLSSASSDPSIAVTGRAPSDPLNTLRSEKNVLTSTHYQTVLNWGDYSAMSVDPIDDCTFWYTTEYLEQNGSFVWGTVIASFRFPTCSK